MKKTFALLLACLMMLGTVTAFADGSANVQSYYTPITNIQNTVTHTLTLTETEATALDCKITYSFEVVANSFTTTPTFVDVTKAITGEPTFTGSIVYDDKTEFTTAKTSTVQLPIDWSGVTIYQPGVYRWTVQKSVNVENSNKDATNDWSTFYLYVYATASGNDDKNLTCTVLTTIDETLDKETEAKDKGNLGDTYPARVVDLTIAKNVAGNQGSRDQYFKFELSVTAPAGAYEKTYTLGGNFDESVPTSAYNTSANLSNPKTITLTGGKAGTIVFYLKHGQSVRIEDLTFGTSFTAVETEANGYTVTYTHEEGNNSVDKDKQGSTVTDTGIQADSTVTFTNTKNATVPTGISLHTAAPVMGILLAMSLLAILFVGKRKEYVA